MFSIYAIVICLSLYVNVQRTVVMYCVLAQLLQCINQGVWNLIPSLTNVFAGFTFCLRISLHFYSWNAQFSTYFKCYRCYYVPALKDEHNISNVFVFDISVFNNYLLDNIFNHYSYTNLNIPVCTFADVSALVVSCLHLHGSCQSVSDISRVRHQS